MLLKMLSKAEIILDARMIRHSGIGTYLRGLIEGYRNQPFFEKHPLAFSFSPSLGFEAAGDGGWVPFCAPIYSVWEQMEYPIRMRHARLWHAPHYNIPLVKPRPALVVTVHDLIHWIFRKKFYSRAQALYASIFFRRVAQIADRIIAVSHQTKNDLIKHFDVPEDRIRVVYEGVSESFFTPSTRDEQKQILEKYGLPGEFFLTVGLLKPHKNVERLLRVFEKLRQSKKIRSALVVVGRKDRRYGKGRESLRRLKTGNGIFYLPEVHGRQELALLYRAAKCLVHPSYYEGFGLTCLEAMASGTPVIVSRAASLPEVVGEAGRYIDPASDVSLEGALLELEEDPELRKSLSQKGPARARNFTWAKAAQETIQIYGELLK